MDAGQIIWMIVIFIIFGVPILIWAFNSLSERIRENSKQTQKYKELFAKEQQIASTQLELTTKSTELEAKIKYYDDLILDFDKIIEQKCSYYPELAVIMADLKTAHYEHSAQYLERKERPARVEAQRIRTLKQETQKILSEYKLIEYKLEYIKKLFPDIDNIFDDGFLSEHELDTDPDDTFDRTRNYISNEEYQALSVTARNQLALDRYIESRKSKWQIGRDYEMYIGYQYEKKGYSVKYTGIIENLEDMGRDLIARKGKTVIIIQCKNWSQEKTIHEKHIFQLFGTMILYKIENPNADITALFVTTTKLSDKARIIAEHLNIVVREQISLRSFPRIKCNINRTTGEKIYHLPFDQQYDNVVIDKAKGEFMAFTVEEAENAGYRRAFKHLA